MLYEWAFIILICLYFLWSMILRLSFILLNTLNFFLTNWYSNFLLECRILISLFFGLCWFEISTIHFHLFFEHILNEIQRKKASNLNNFYTKCQQEINRNNDISYTVTLKQLFQSSSNTNMSDLSGFWMVADFECWDLPLNLVLRGASTSSCVFCKPLSAMCWAWVASSKQWSWANCSYPRGNGFSHNIHSLTDLKKKKRSHGYTCINDEWKQYSIEKKRREVMAILMMNDNNTQ